MSDADAPRLTGRRRWIRAWRGPAGDVHVLPIADLRKHVEARDCWCHPELCREPDAPAVDCRLVVHHAADGRELVEQHGIN